MGQKCEREDSAEDMDMTAQTRRGCSVLPLPWFIERASSRHPTLHFLPNTMPKQVPKSYPNLKLQAKLVCTNIALTPSCFTVPVLLSHIMHLLIFIHGILAFLLQ